MRRCDDDDIRGFEMLCESQDLSVAAYGALGMGNPTVCRVESVLVLRIEQ